MADLKGMLRRAKADTLDIQTNAKNIHRTKEQLERIVSDGRTAARDFAEGYPDTTTLAMDEAETKLEKLTAKLESGSIALQQKIEKSKETLEKVKLASENNFTDATSRRMMYDYAENYKLAYILVWAKVLLAVTLLYLMRSRQNFLLMAVVFVIVVLLWYFWTMIKHFLMGRTPKGGDTSDGKLCADGTPSDATGSNCSTSPTQPPNVYMACEETPFGCCPDGMPSPAADGVGCAAALSCASSTYGCCPDGLSARTDASGSTCDYTYFGDCTASKFGCCPNGGVKQDELGSNCMPNNLCGFSAFGCCSNGSDRADMVGTNCAAT